MEISLQMKYSIGFGIAALAFGLFAIFALPPDREVKSLAIFLFKLLPFALAAIAIALFDPAVLGRLNGIKILLIYACFGLFFSSTFPNSF